MCFPCILRIACWNTGATYTYAGIDDTIPGYIDNNEPMINGTDGYRHAKDRIGVLCIHNQK
jgi:hypothetical protein